MKTRQRTLFFSAIPPDFEQLKSENASKVPILGSAIFTAEVFKSLLRYCTYDRIVFPDVPRNARGDLRDSPIYLENAHRVRCMTDHQMSDLARAEHLIFFSPGPNLTTLARARRLSGAHRSPVVGIIHSMNYANQMASVVGLMSASLHHYDALICSSTGGLRAVGNIFKCVRKRMASTGLADRGIPVQTPVIPLGVDTDAFSLESGDRNDWDIGPGTVLLYVGRFSSTSKGDLLPLLVGFGKILTVHPETWLILAGDDTQQCIAEKLREFAIALGCGHRVRIVPNPDQCQKLALYRSADLFVSLADSLQETFGITLIEAMAAGLPIIASDWNGYKDLVVDGETGFLVPTAFAEYPAHFDDVRGGGSMNVPDILAATTVVDLNVFVRSADVLIRSGDLRHQFSRAARERARSLYDWRVVVARYEELWAELGEAARSSPTDESDCDVAWDNLPYLEIFNHYPTRTVAADTAVRITHLGRLWSGNPNLLRAVASPESWFDRTHLERVLHCLIAHNTLPINDLLQITFEEDRRSMIGMTHVCRLWKYGLIEAVDEQYFPPQLPASTMR